jgi:TolB-like protein
LRGQYSEWLDATRAEIDACIADGLALHIARCEAARDWQAVKALANAWLRRDQYSEPAIAALIRAELSSGSRAAAHIRYQAFRTQLAAEIGVEPDPLVDAAMRGEGTVPATYAAVDVAVQAEPSPVGVPAQPPVPAVDDPGIVLAVLAFDNLSADGDLGWFCDGVAEEIQRTVARGTEIKVVARSSSFQFRGAEKAVATVCAALGTSHLLDGSVRRSGSKVRITAELIECQSHSIVWTERFDGDFGDVFDLQDRIAEQVARALAVTFARTAPTVPLDPEVYEVFLRARCTLAEGDAQFDNAAREAVPLFEMVTRAAPAYAPGWELLAVARANALRSGRSDQPYLEGRELVLAEAETALRLDPGRGGAYSALAMLEPWGAYAARERLLRQALDVAPRDPAALTDMSNFCWGVGRFREALSFAEQACELNPLMPAARLHGAQMRTYVGDYEASIRMFEELHARWPQNLRILVALMDCAAALGFWDAYDRAVVAIDSFEGHQRKHLAMTRKHDDALRSKDPADVDACVASYIRQFAKYGTLPLNYIMGISDLGRLETAFTLAEQSSYDFVFDRQGAPISAYYPGAIMGRWSPIIRELRGLRLLNRIGLCDYWLSSGKWPDCVDYVPYDFKAETWRIVRETVKPD